MIDGNPRRPLMSTMKATLVGSAMIALGPISLSLYTPAMPTLAAAFGSTLAAIKMTMSLYFVGFSLSQLICGPLSDAFGRRPVNLAFLSLYLGASVVATFAQDIEALMIARLVQGIGAAAGVAVARAMVRDLFVGQESARVMNAMGIFLAIGPAVSPTLGGLMLQLFDWRAIFELMVGYGLLVVAMVALLVPETNRAPHIAHAHPAGLMRVYAGLVADRRFIFPGVTLGMSVGGIYTLATILPFVLINKVGLTATAFGYAMMIQTCSYILGGVVVRQCLRLTTAARLVFPGLILCLVAGGAFVVDHFAFVPNILSVMLPVGVFAFGIAFVSPSLTTDALAPFPGTAGAASALLGFCQMGGGLAGSLVATLIPDATLALTVVLPGMMVIAMAAHMAGRTKPAH
ncbi:MAG: multidrug effflux MFS transporter [Ancalomicrobiaceae bacterium]|nr:multidrug effflux MFS transporter [Ancalomicrobiaceae bacterium]